MSPEILIALLSFMGVPAAFTGFCFWNLKKHLDKKDNVRDEKERSREKFEFMMIKSNSAAIALGEATAHAIRDGKCNGEMSKALDYAQNVKYEQKDFLTELSIKQIN